MLYRYLYICLYGVCGYMYECVYDIHIIYNYFILGSHLSVQSARLGKVRDYFCLFVLCFFLFFYLKE